MYRGKRLFGDPGSATGARPVPGPRAAAPRPPGELPRPGQGRPAAASAGYVFLCGRGAQADSLRLGVLGAPAKELGQMKQCISPETQLFLFNVETFKLVGRFVATSTPERDIAPGAFGGGCAAQVRATPLDLSLLEVELDEWVVPGPRSAADVQALNSHLRQGCVAPGQGQLVKPELPEAPNSRLSQGRVVPARGPLVKPEAVQPAPKRRRTEQHSIAQPDQGKQDAGPSLCWDHVKGKCPRGLQCRFCHGYVFSCTDATQRECQEKKLFGSPERDLSVMSACIQPGTELLLFNFESCRLLGPFVAASAPGRRLEPSAFGGKFSAHVRAELRPEAPLLEAALEGRVQGGPKNAAELEKLKQSLVERGKAVNEDLRLAWSTELVQPKEEEVEDTDSMFCWDFAKGHCPRGKKCRYLHLEGEAAGYVFLCNSRTMADCGTFRLLGSPAKELRQMQHCIKPDTQLFLLNFETLKLIGPFVGISTPELDIAHEAFGGKFSAQICAEPLAEPLLQAALRERLRAGPKSAAEVEQLRGALAAGGAAPDDLQDVWAKLEAT